ncbi:V-type ATP synthase subunit I domain-containing protein [[Lactobacillus] timonensis]|uniref:hypothetical protein n=1 Tax=[Lactobacillus] timonensis TaxID=1970790 RepID=UPI000C824C15|nr:hypothetical protein [[Lactobacillus] timonensis]
MIKRKFSRVFFNLLLLLMIACVATYPAFIGHNLFLTYDGNVFLGRIEQIYQSFVHFKLPTPISYIGLDHNLGAMSAMYPWMTSTIFVMPMLFLKNKMLAMVTGFVILNFLTAFNFYLLSRHLTNKKVYQYLGVTIYVFNGYHIEDLYVRNAMGESLAYAFIPLVVLGCLMIWDVHSRQKGLYVLPLGIIGVLNSHILSFVLVVGCLAFAEVVRLILGKMCWKEVIVFLCSALLSILGSIYFLFQFLKIQLFNRYLFIPASQLNYVSPWTAFQEMINNHMRVLYSTWHIGIVAFCLLGLLLIMSMNAKRLYAWGWLSWIALVGLLFSFGFIPYPHIFDILIVQKFQFTGRIYVLVVLCISVSIVMYCQHVGTNKWLTSILIILSISIGWSSILNYKNNPVILNHAESVYELTNAKYNWNYNHGASWCQDYTNDYPSKGKKPQKVSWQTSTYNSATYNIHIRHKGEYLLPMSYFKNQQYKLILNGERVNYGVRHGHFLLHFNQHHNVLRISSDTHLINYVMFTISVITVIALLYIVLQNGMSVHRYYV